MGFNVGQAGLELPTSGDPPILASQSAGITGVSHRVWRTHYFFFPRKRKKDHWHEAGRRINLIFRILKVLLPAHRVESHRFPLDLERAVLDEVIAYSITYIAITCAAVSESALFPSQYEDITAAHDKSPLAHCTAALNPGEPRAHSGGLGF